MVEDCAKASNADGAYALYRSLRYHGFESSSSASSALIISLCAAGRLDTAVTVRGISEKHAFQLVCTQYE